MSSAEHSEPGSPQGSLRELWALSLPVALGHLGFILMGLVDVMMVGRLGAAQMAAVSLANLLISVPSIFGVGVMMAASTLVSQNHGAGRLERCGLVLGQSLRLAVVIGLATAAFLWFSDPLDTLLSPDPEVRRELRAYVRWRALDPLVWLLTAAYKSYLDGMGRGRPGMVIFMGANVVNALANWVFMFGALGFPAMGLAGTGLATVVTRACIVLAFVATIHLLGAGREGLMARWWRLDVPLIRQLAAVGTPTGIQHALEVGAFGSFGLLAGYVGTAQLAGHQIALALSSMTFVMAMGFGVGATVMVGRNIGRGDFDAAARVGNQAMATAASLAGMACVVLLAFPAQLARLFTDDAAALVHGELLIHFAAAFLVVDSLQAVASGALRGAGDTRGPMLLSILTHWALGIPAAWWLGLHLSYGAPGIWVAMNTLLFVLAFVMVLRFRRGAWRSIDLLEKTPNASAP